MQTATFDRDATARRYAKDHLRTDPGLVSVYHLPEGAGEKEIRLLEVNKLLGDRTDELMEPLDFGADRGSENEHLLVILDVTPKQWAKIEKESIALPQGWSLEGKQELP